MMRICHNEDDTVFGCVGCQRKCRTRAGEAAHMFRVHQQVSGLRLLADEPTCSACLKNFHTMAKLKAHLYYTERCQEVLRSRNLRCQVVPGAGSKQDGERVKAHDRLLPPLTGHGPHLPPQRRWETCNIDDGVHQFLIDALIELPDHNSFEHRVRSHVAGLAISWTCLRRTFLFFMDTLDENDEVQIGFNLQKIKAVLCGLSSPHNWPFLRDVLKVRQQDNLQTLEGVRMHVLNKH